MKTVKIYVLLVLVLLHSALGSPLLVVTITQISTFVAVLPYQTATRWISITTYVPINPQSTDLVLSTFSEALLSRVTPHQTFLVTSQYLTTLAGLDSSTTTPTETPTTLVSTGVAPSTTTDIVPQAANSSPNFPTAATISISVVVTLLVVGLIAFCWRRHYRRKYGTAVIAREMLTLQEQVLGPLPPSKLSMTTSPDSGGHPSWTVLQQAASVVHPGIPVDLSLTPITNANSEQILQNQPFSRYSNADYSSRGSSAFDMNDIQRARSQTWGSTTTAIQSPEPVPGRFPSAHQHLSSSQSTQEQIIIQEREQNHPVYHQSDRGPHWDEAIRRLNALGRNSLSPPPLNIVKRNASTLYRVSSPEEHMVNPGPRTLTPVSQMTALETTTGESSEPPNTPRSIEGQRKHTLAVLEGATIRRRYSPSVYSRMVDGTIVDGIPARGSEESLEWRKMFERRAA